VLTQLFTLPERLAPLAGALAGFAALGLLGFGASRFYALLSARPLSPEARDIPLSLLLSLLRVALGVLLAAALALPLAYWTFRHTRVRSALLTALQILGSVPAPAFFPLIALLMLHFRLGMNVGSVLLVLTGTFFYVMFNVLAGATAIPKEMNEAAAGLGLRGWGYLRRVFVPAVLPSLVTGCVTAWGGGWNAIIFSEYVVAGGRLYSVRGIGAALDRATYVTGDMQVVTLSLLSMVALVVLINRLFWDPLYQHVAERCKMEA
jgi:NitT/TauT family transport system permease protein